MQTIYDFGQWLINDDNVSLFLCFWFFLTGFTLGFFGMLLVNYSIYTRFFTYFMENKRRKNRKLSEMSATIKRLKAELGERRDA